MNLNVSVPINNLSFGFCGYNILKELYNRGISPCIFPIGQPDISSFDRCGDDWKMWLESGIKKASKHYSKDFLGIKLWHLNGSQESVSKNQRLVSFYELDEPQKEEINIVKNQEKTFFTSKYTVDLFKSLGAENVQYAPLGFDSENFRVIDKHPYAKSCIVFGLFQKFERRKHTDKVIKIWTKLFGNNPKYRLHIHTFNPFFSPEQNQQLLNNAFEGKQYWNCNIINSYLRTLTELNQMYNSIDVVLGLSGNEGFSIPDFTCVGLGKHAVIHAENAQKDWATSENAILVKSKSKIEAYDGCFFHKGQNFNQGNLFCFDDEEVVEAMREVVKRVESDRVNHEGLKLQKDYTWSNFVDNLLNAN